MNRVHRVSPPPYAASGTRRRRLLAAAVAAGLSWGCNSATTTPRVIYLEGAGWFGSAGSVRSGLRSGGYRGQFETFTWTTFLLAPADYFVAARGPLRAQRLANRIERIRRASPQGTIHLIGLSAGTFLIVRALERLPEAVQVDQVVLFSSSISAQRDLTPALKRVRGRLYATCSPGDRLLASLALSVEGRTGKVAGQRGFRLPENPTEEQKHQYAKVVNLLWRPAYAGFGWSGGHVAVTKSSFVQAVIAPRIRSPQPFPLDRPLVAAVQEEELVESHATD